MIIEDKSDPKKPILLINEINAVEAKNYIDKLYKPLEKTKEPNPVVEECHKKITRRWKAWTKSGNSLARKLRRADRYADYLQYTHRVKL